MTCQFDSTPPFMVGYLAMWPVLFSVGNVTISSFGVLLALAFLFGVFLIWRLVRAWDLPQEKILDLILLTFVGGLILARVYFVLEHWQLFSSLDRILLVNKYPGFSFWGSFLGGWLALYFFSKKFKMDFLAMADMGAVGFLGGLILGDLGCFLGGCGIGVPSNLPFAVSMVGVIGKRFPVQVIEALILIFVLMRVWRRATHFHIRGLIVSQALIYLGAVKLLMEPLREAKGNFLFPATLVVLGVYLFYQIHSGKRTFFSDARAVFRFTGAFLGDARTRNLTLLQLKKSWYNQKIALSWRMRSIGKILRRMRVKPAP